MIYRSTGTRLVMLIIHLLNIVLVKVFQNAPRISRNQRISFQHSACIRLMESKQSDAVGINI